MPISPLPERASLEQLRNQAKDLQRGVRAGSREALAEIAEHHPRGLPDDDDAARSFPLAGAQAVVARRHGFASWPRLKGHLDILERYSRYPGPMAPDGTEDPASAFLRGACLSYDDDGPDRWRQARALLVEHPEIVGRSVHVAAAVADVDALRRLIRADPAAARTEGGPFRWEPLVYLAYDRHEPTVAKDVVLRAARLLLDAGADPNAGYLWHGLPTPFTVLTGALGEGELGPARQPRHPHWLALARLLLESGADANDGQGLYNRMFEPGNDHLELLFEFGLGHGDGGPWRERLGDALASPAAMIRGQLSWAVTHGMSERVRLLVGHGADVASALDDGTTLSALAATTGHADLVDYLVAHGAPQLDLEPVAAFVAAALAADRSVLDRLAAEDPDLATVARNAHPALVVWAAAHGRPGSVNLLVELGFDVNAKGRTDVPRNDRWQTALHHAAEKGDVGLARELLALGADTDIKDQRFDATPLGWAHHFGNETVAALLEPITTHAQPGNTARETATAPPDTVVRDSGKGVQRGHSG